MPDSVIIEISEVAGQFRIPTALNDRLQFLLDQQDQGTPLTITEQREADGLVRVAETMALFRLRSKRITN